VKDDRSACTWPIKGCDDDSMLAACRQCLIVFEEYGNHHGDELKICL